MKEKEEQRFNELYVRHLKLLKLQGKRESTIDGYSRAVRHLSAYFDCCPDKLIPKQLEDYFADLLKERSWSTVKVYLSGLKFFWEHVLATEWDWIKIVKPPKVRTIPDILSTNEIRQVIEATEKLRYRVFFLATYSMGLRLGEALSLQVSDIDTDHKRIHVRRGKGHKDRFVPLPEFTLWSLRILWCRHHNPTFLFPNATGSMDTIKHAQTHMDRGGAQNALKVVLAQCGIKKKSTFIRFDIAMPLIYSNAE